MVKTHFQVRPIRGTGTALHLGTCFLQYWHVFPYPVNTCRDGALKGLRGLREVCPSCQSPPDSRFLTPKEGLTNVRGLRQSELLSNDSWVLLPGVGATPLGLAHTRTLPPNPLPPRSKTPSGHNLQTRRRG